MINYTHEQPAKITASCLATNHPTAVPTHHGTGMQGGRAGKSRGNTYHTFRPYMKVYVHSVFIQVKAFIQNPSQLIAMRVWSKWIEPLHSALNPLVTCEPNPLYNKNSMLGICPPSQFHQPIQILVCYRIAGNFRDFRDQTPARKKFFLQKIFPPKIFLLTS